MVPVRFLKEIFVHTVEENGFIPNPCEASPLNVDSQESTVRRLTVRNTVVLPSDTLTGLCVSGRGYEQSCLQALNGSYPVISGYVELVRRPLEDSGRMCDYFTVMRHPIDRLVSAFFYCPDHDPQNRPVKW